MQHGDAPGPGSAKSKRQRKVVALGAAGDQARRLQELGDTLDDLVRAVRAGDPLADGLSRRVYELWSAERAHVWQWHPTELRAAGKLVLAAGAQGGRFILPAFAAGLRALAMRAQCTPGDALRLAEELAMLESGERSPQAFASFIWRGGALGFDTAQHESVFELYEGMVGDVDEAALWAERSKSAVDVWNGLAWQVAQVLPAAAIAEHYRAPLERMQQRCARGELGLGEQELRALRELADDEAAWGKVEIKLMLQLPGLRATLSSAHLTWRLSALIENAAELARLPALFTSLGGVNAGAGGAALDPLILGEAFGRRLLGRGAEPAALLAFVEQFGAELLTGMFAHLNTRDDCGEQVQRMLLVLIERSDLRAVLARIDAPRLQPAFARALVRAAHGANVPSADLIALLERLPARSALAALAGSPELLRAAQRVLHGLIAERAGHVEPLLPEFVRTSALAAQIVGAGILAVHGAGFTSDGLAPILSTLVQMGRGVELVLPLWESRNAQTGVRLAALAALEPERPLLAEAMRRRGVEPLDPPEIRIAVEELRWRQP